MNIPNILTIFRISMVPVFVGVFYWPSEDSYWLAALIFAVAGWTDWFDGYIARRFNMMSPLGAFLDPVADKLMVTISLVLVVEAYRTPWIAVPALIIIGREITVSALRQWMAELGQTDAVQVDFTGKAKTMGQLSAIFFFLLGEQTHIYFVYLGYIALYISVALTVWSMLIYLRAAWPWLTGTREPS